MYIIQVVLILSTVRSGFAEKDIDFSIVGDKNISRPFTLKVLRMICPDQPYDYTVVKTCKAKLTRNQPTKLHLALDIQRPANKLFLSYVLNYKYNTYKPLLFDDSFDLCRFMAEKGTGNNLLMNFMYRIAKSQISWLHKCPYEVSFTQLH